MTVPGPTRVKSTPSVALEVLASEGLALEVAFGISILHHFSCDAASFWRCAGVWITCILQVF
jgi:hypothetical protein